MSADLLLLAIFGPTAFFTVNVVGFLICCILVLVRSSAKGFGNLAIILVVASMMALAVWMYELTHTSLLPLLISLLLAFFLPEFVNWIKDFSFNPSLGMSLLILVLVILSWIWLFPFLSLRQGANIISALMVILSASTLLSGLYVFVGLDRKFSLGEKTNAV